MPPVSVLDLALVPQGSTPAEALRNTLDLARHAEQWGYTRYWLAEHHNMVGIARAAPCGAWEHAKSWGDHAAAAVALWSSFAGRKPG